MKKVIIYFIGVFFIPLFANAQFWEIGGMIGGSNYAGDLSPTPIVLKETHPAIGAFVRANVKKSLSFKGNLYYGVVSGTDENTTVEKNRRRNLNFRSSILEVGLNAELNLMPFETGSRKNKTAPYVFGGLAIFKFDPKAYFDTNPNDDTEGEYVRLQPLGTEGQGTTQFNDREKYSLTQVSIPFGMGLKHNFSGNWNVGLEAGLRKTFTDYIDDVSKTYVEYYILDQQGSELSPILADRTQEYDPTHNPENRTKLEERGNETTKDWYMFAGITVSYTIMPKYCFRF
ncbi:MAG: type IX secretion system protein PorG [Bacteroidia bacterium]